MVRALPSIHSSSGLTSYIDSVYTVNMSTMRAKLFKNGASQAVRLPREFRFPDGQTEVMVRREGRTIVLEPVDEWTQEFLDMLGTLDEELPRMPQQPITKMRDPFRR